LRNWFYSESDRCVLPKTVPHHNPKSNPMKSHTKPKLRFRRLILLGSAFAGLGLVNAPAEVTTVEIVHYFNVQGQLDALNQLQKDFESANPDIKIHYTYVPFGELVSRTLQMAAVHNPPGISCVDNPDVLRVAKAGILEDISADVTKLQVWNDMYAGPKAAVTDGSKVYGMPIGSNSLALYYNKKLLSDAGVSAPPQTWDQLTETASKTTKSPVYGIAFSAVNTEEATWQWEPFLWSNGGSLTDLSSKNAQAALELWVDWVKKGYASKDVVNWNQGDVPNQFIGGSAATMVMGPWQLANVKKSGVDFGIVTIPVPKEGSKPVVPLGGEVWCVLKGDPKVEQAAVKFIEFTQDPERLRKICDTFNYISSIRSVAKQQGEANPELKPFVDQMDTARARSQDGGAKYPEISLATRTAIQQALTGQSSAEDALKAAAEKIKSILGQ
jgi:multiple sugar transport system substrate-binding protein